MSADLSSDGIAPEDWKPLHPLTYVPRVAGSVTGIVAAVSLSNASAIGRMAQRVRRPRWLATTGIFLGLADYCVALLSPSAGVVLLPVVDEDALRGEQRQRSGIAPVSSSGRSATRG